MKKSYSLVWTRSKLALAVIVYAQAAALPGVVRDHLASTPSTSVLAPVPVGGFSVLTYNIHGLPWPIVSDRSAALADIGRRLKALHQIGAAPRVAVLQEAFTSDARALAFASGYRYVAFGPGSDGRYAAVLPAGVTPKSLQAGERWWKGEGVGKWTGSGLVLLSDYPIIRVRRLAYSDAACAGFDCLAAKGAILAELVMPNGHDVEIATTHLNSRRASGVGNDRANRAWLVQAAELGDFIARRRNPALPLILGGDFNVGVDLVRRLGISDLGATIDGRTFDGLRSLQSRGTFLDNDTEHALIRAKDWELVLPGVGGALVPRRAWVPFGFNSGSPLSDHYGYAISYTARYISIS